MGGNDEETEAERSEERRSDQVCTPTMYMCVCLYMCVCVPKARAQV